MLRTHLKPQKKKTISAWLTNLAFGTELDTEVQKCKALFSSQQKRTGETIQQYAESGATSAWAIKLLPLKMLHHLDAPQMKYSESRTMCIKSDLLYNELTFSV